MKVGVPAITVVSGFHHLLQTSGVGFLPIVGSIVAGVILGLWKEIKPVDVKGY